MLITQKILPTPLALAIAAIAYGALPVWAEETQAVDEVIVTGTVKAVTKLEASVSVSALGAVDIAQSAPRSIGEVFRSLPGIRAESSGGGGNANINLYYQNLSNKNANSF